MDDEFLRTHTTKNIELGMTEPEAFAEFEREVAMLPPGRVSADKTKILMPVESFVISFEEKAQEEVTMYGTKDTLMCV